MEFVHGECAASVALLAGAWNPPTRAHVELARAALGWARRAVFVLPSALPHKQFEDAGAEQRIEWIIRLAGADSRFAAARSQGGLFIEIAREARACHANRIFLVCGSDAAARIVNWDYGAGPSIESQLAEYEILAAPRPSPYSPPAALAPRIHTLIVPASMTALSSSDVRRRIRSGAPWRHLVPAEVADSAATAYS